MDPISLEVMKNAFTFVPEEMGQALRRTAYSPNIKERMDASCAIFDARGRMVAQAEHIPVHLGSMPLAIQAIEEYLQEPLEEGDQVILNDPYRGGFAPERHHPHQAGLLGRGSCRVRGQQGPPRGRRGHRAGVDANGQPNPL